VNYHATQATVLRGLLGGKITAVIRSMEDSATGDNTGLAGLYQAKLEIHNEFPTRRQHRIDFLEGVSVKYSLKEGSPIMKTGGSIFGVGLSMAAGRYTSAATRRGLLPVFFKNFAGFAEKVVLPEPCNPATRMTVGGMFEVLISVFDSPSSLTISSWMILMISCPGVTLFITSWPTARVWTF